MQKVYPKILLVSNNGISDTSNNGRTLGNLIALWPKDCVAQFCISISNPNYSICDNYYVLTDNEVLSAFVKCRKAKRCEMVNAVNTEGNTLIRGRHSVKTGTKVLLRHLAWMNRWNSSEFYSWVENFHPDIVLCYNSDSAFILDIARCIHSQRNIPLIMYNTEGFYLFKHHYYRRESFFDKICFPIYRMIYKKSYKKFMDDVSCVIYLNDKLQKDYSAKFNHQSYVIYTSSSLKFDLNGADISKNNFYYIGNLGYNRWKALIIVADVLREINSSFILDIFGKTQDPEAQSALINCPNIRMNGYLDYLGVKEKLYSSSILFHAEVFDPDFYNELKYGFSTKIADSISSGHCFVIFDESNTAGAEYVNHSQCGWLARSREELKKIIIEVLTNNSKRQIVLEKARNVSESNHSLYNNHCRLHSIILKTIDTYKK